MRKTELIWAGVVVFSLIIFLSVLVYAINVGYNTPGITEHANVKDFKTGVFKIDEGVYEVHILAAQFYFDPYTITLKDPVKVIFKIMSQDVIHGFSIIGTNVNVMVVPGYITTVIWYPPTNFKGNFTIICDEYCGPGHSNMFATLIIER